ncbi:2-oxo acid dehydrogenase acyltransferase (catalytic domain) [Aeromicrobium marinum DSM 15272]|uniref:Dihydrolipoamide acetyltransferase component of pyruvate dehydrogenase complex n=1 Tax=Aeromicrobium marinum DSM 15272 TaxID=585531 RepID=E2SFD6_9ACTN|nr:dihydrolipoamide acetyltransferase family protein [Aeromicrobium marinum]EFQ82037.1 2-oxo acid dehydrogenase acyltransferase (catalytic domain) [Aeromicrobium marinum DSM 15272]
MSEFRLPDVGEGLTEADIVTWHVAVGDVVAVNDVLVDIETAKSIVELPSPFAGEVTELLVEEGRTVTVGTPIVRIGAPASGADAGAETSQDTAAPERHGVLVGYGPREGRPHRRRRRTSSAVDAPVVAPVASRPLAKPPVRKLAKDLGVDLTEVPCDGVVTRADVEAFARDREQAVTPVAPPGGDRRVPVTGVRRATAEAMVASAFTAPHVTEWVTVDVSRTMALLERLRSDRAWSEVSLTPLALVARAVCLALRRTPELTGAWDGDAITYPEQVDLGIAAATERGLVVPNIRGADALDLRGLATALSELTATARAGRVQPADLAGGTFTITNIGVFGIDAGTPILNPGQSGILAVGAINRRPWVDEHDQVVPRWVTTLALSFDHRVVDGEQGSRFLADVASVLRDPDLALTW